jgi:NAD(P)-dependent dehydrogenase (short-subunit alcohol dehydrogenase family)
VETAVVTGAGRGIGREIALRLAARGYAVLATDVEEATAAETAERAGANAWPMALDARNPEAHRAAARAAAERGPLKVWVNNAGVAQARKAWEHPDEEVRLMADANFLGVLWGSRAAVDAMRDGGGHLVNIASLSSLGPVPGLAVYGATKHAVLGFSVSLQGDLDHAGIPIRVHAVCPDAVDTRMVRDVEAEPEAAILFSAGRLLRAEEVAERVVGLLDGKRIVEVIPHWRAWLVRFATPFPRADLKMLALLRRVGERRRAARS